MSYVTTTDRRWGDSEWLRSSGKELTRKTDHALLNTGLEIGQNTNINSVDFRDLLIAWKMRGSLWRLLLVMFHVKEVIEWKWGRRKGTGWEGGLNGENQERQNGGGAEKVEETGCPIGRLSESSHCRKTISDGSELYFNLNASANFLTLFFTESCLTKHPSYRLRGGLSDFFNGL